MWKCCVLCIFVFVSFWDGVYGSLAEEMAETTQLCCNQGTSYARNHTSEDCSSSIPPDVPKAFAALCLFAMDQCCQEYFEKKRDCDSGIDIATSSNRCDSTKESVKNCCDECAKGATSGSSGGAGVCVKRPRGSSADELLAVDAFAQCCKKAAKEEKGGSESSSSSGDSRPVTLSRTPSISAASLCEEYAPNELCAHHCIPVPGSYKCECNPGFMLMADGRNCMEVVKNRCKPRNPCQHKCNDNGVEVKCSCRRGYKLMSDGKSCEDIDECLLNPPVCLSGTQCYNIQGSYKCIPTKKSTNSNAEKGQCPPGFVRNVKNNVCDDINECTLLNPPCPSYLCENTIGGYKCGGVSGDPSNFGNKAVADDRCPPGFWMGPSEECEDMDECTLRKDDCNPLSQFCINTRGSYFCQNKVSKHCHPGFKIDPRTNKCEDINECEEGQDICRSDQICVNVPGEYDCKLKDDYRRRTANKCPDGMRMKPGSNVCEDIDECVEGTHLCDQYQSCLNTNGSHECHCKLGFEHDPITGACADVNECATDQHNCIPGSQRCDNTVGSFLCIRFTPCGTGYILHHTTSECEDIDECALGTHNCDKAGPDYFCENHPGSFRCIKRRRSTTSTTLPPSEYEYYYDSDEDVSETNQSKPAENKPSEISTTTSPESPKTTPTTLSTRPTESSPSPEEPSRPREGPDSIDTRFNNVEPPEQNPYNEPRQPEQHNYNQPEQTNNSNGPQQPEQPNYNQPQPHSPTYNERQPETPEFNRPQQPETPDYNKPQQPESPNYDQPQQPERPNYNQQQSTPPTYIEPSSQQPQQPEARPTESQPPESPTYYYEPRTPQESTQPEQPRQIGTPSETQQPQPTEPQRPIEPSQPEQSNNDSLPPELEKPETTYRPEPSPTPPQVVFVSVGKETATIEGQKRNDGSVVVDTKDVPENEWTKVKERPSNCQIGFESDEYGACVDIDECATVRHSCSGLTEVCRNTMGGYLCDCAPGFRRSLANGVCDIITTSSSSTSTTEPPPPPPPPPSSTTERSRSFFWGYPDYRQQTTRPFRPRNLCDVGYHLNSKTRECEDINECTNGQANCAAVEICVNTEGGYRCECPPNWRLDEIRHRCVPVRSKGQFPPGYGNEPGYPPIPPSANPEDVQKVFKGPQYVEPQVTQLEDRGSVITCPGGYKLGYDNTCEDIDECSTGQATCGAMLCTNLPGGYVCSCPPGHKLIDQNRCEDVDECTLGGNMPVCSQNADCVNTVGSYQCRCHTGFRSAPVNDKVCVDVDECTESQTGSLCQHRCNNVWGGYRCTCHKGYRLNADNSTCSDIDECVEFKSKIICVGRCLNEPGSYRCTCPQGYRLAEDKRSCIDIDECETGEAPCAKGGTYAGTSDVCLNTRGGYRCHRITCPPGYKLESRHRCTRIEKICPPADWDCAHQPTTYSYNFITFVSKLYIPASKVDLFTMRGPSWPNAKMRFQLRLVDVNAPPTVKDKADINAFLLVQTGNQAVMSLVRSLEGPQSIELELSMDLYNGDQFGGIAVARLYIYVSEYEF